MDYNAERKALDVDWRDEYGFLHEKIGLTSVQLEGILRIEKARARDNCSEIRILNEEIANLSAQLRDLKRSPLPDPVDDDVVSDLDRDQLLKDNQRLRAFIRELLSSDDPHQKWRDKIAPWMLSRPEGEQEPHGPQDEVHNKVKAKSPGDPMEHRE